MKTFDDYCKDLFAATLQYGGSDFQIMLGFLDLADKGLFSGIWAELSRFIGAFHKLTGEVICVDEFTDFVNSSQNLTEEVCRTYLELFSDLLKHQVKANAFQFYVSQLISRFKFESANLLLHDASQALISGTTIGQKVFQGYDGMREIVLKGIYDIDRRIDANLMEGNVLDEAYKVIEEYKTLHSRGDHLSTGFSVIDQYTGGLFPGELWLWIGFSGEGKTFSCINIGYDVAFKQKKNVLFLTSETVRSVVRRRLISRHARELTGNGINLTEWKTGNLGSDSLEVLKNTLQDMDSRKNDYGFFHLVQIPSNATTDFVAAALASYQTKFNVDLCILDSIHLLTPKKTRQSSYAELDDILIEIKHIAVSHNKGKGVPLASPWHCNRSSWEKAKEDGKYTKASLAKTSEAERQADVIVSILKEDGEKRIKGSIIKNRDGEELDEFYLEYDFSQGYIGINDLAQEALSVSIESLLNID
jgi:hypothetical protein